MAAVLPYVAQRLAKSPTFISLSSVQHLVGKLRRDRTYTNRLILSRKSDALSPKIRAMNGHWIARIQITDPIWKTATLTNVQIKVAGANYSFTFTAIAVENLAGSTSTADDVTASGNWPP